MSEAPRPSPWVPTLVAFLVPGAGHAMIRKPWPAAFVAGTILPLFGVGLVLGGFANVSWERHPWLFVVQALAGLPAGVAALATRSVVPTEPLAHGTEADLFTCVAGLLNLVALVDVWARCREGDPEERLARRHAEEDMLGAQSLVAPEAPPPASVAPSAGEAPRG